MRERFHRMMGSHLRARSEDLNKPEKIEDYKFQGFYSYLAEGQPPSLSQTLPLPTAPLKAIDMATAFSLAC